MPRSRVTRLLPPIAAVAAVVPDNPDGSLDPGTADFVYAVRVPPTTTTTTTVPDDVVGATKPNTIGSIANAAALTLGAEDIGGDWFRVDMDDAILLIG
jgi:hypothetical protein